MSKWTNVPFTSAFEVMSDQGKRMAKGDYVDTGRYPVIDQGEEPIGGYTDNHDLVYQGPLPVILFGDHTRRFKYVNKEFVVGAQGIKILRPMGDLDPKYAHYSLLASELPNRGYSRHFQFLKKISIPVVDELEQQRRIVETIETHLSHLDAGVESLERAKRNVERMRFALLKAAVQGQSATRSDDDVEVDDLFGRIRTEVGKEPRSTDQVFEVPEHWRWVPFEDVTVNLDSRRIPLKAADRQDRQGEYPYYGAQGIIDHVDDYLFDGEHLLIAEDGANLLSRNKPLAFIADGRFWVNNHAHVVRAVGGIPLPFLRLAVNASDMSGRITGTAQPKLTQKNLNSLPIPIPPLPEQYRIVREVERQTSLIDDLEGTLAGTSLRSSALRRTVLASAFSGRLGG